MYKKRKEANTDSWVMILKKMTGICLLFVLTIAAALWIDTSYRDFEKPQTISADENSEEKSEENIEEMTQSMSTLSYAKYFLAEQEGKVVIYHSDKKTLCYETSIRVDHLPQEMKQAVKEGIAVETEEQLYEFLENYSS